MGVCGGGDCTNEITVSRELSHLGTLILSALYGWSVSCIELVRVHLPLSIILKQTFKDTS